MPCCSEHYADLRRSPYLKGTPMLGKLLKGIARILMALMLLLAMLLVGMRVFGLQIYTVLSGSMEPSYRTGGLIYVRKVDAHALEKGQVITFRLQNGTVATHRIVKVLDSESVYGQNAYRTKGDANDDPDAVLVSESQIIGVPLFTIPYLGYLANYIQHPPGLYWTVAVCLLIIIYVLTVDQIVGDKKPKGETQDEKER